MHAEDSTLPRLLHSNFCISHQLVRVQTTCAFFNSLITAHFSATPIHRVPGLSTPYWRRKPPELKIGIVAMKYYYKKKRSKQRLCQLEELAVAPSDDVHFGQPIAAYVRFTCVEMYKCTLSQEDGAFRQAMMRLRSAFEGAFVHVITHSWEFPTRDNVVQYLRAHVLPMLADCHIGELYFFGDHSPRLPLDNTAAAVSLFELLSPFSVVRIHFYFDDLHHVNYAQQAHLSAQERELLGDGIYEEDSGGTMVSLQEMVQWLLCATDSDGGVPGRVKRRRILRIEDDSLGQQNWSKFAKMVHTLKQRFLEHDCASENEAMPSFTVEFHHGYQVMSRNSDGSVSRREQQMEEEFEMWCQHHNNNNVGESGNASGRSRFMLRNGVLESSTMLTPKYTITLTHDHHYHS